jgi:hypothetical protein
MMEEMLDAAPGAVGHHMAHHVFGQNDRRQHVQTDQRLDLGIAHIGQQPFGADSGVVDEAVDRAEGVAQFRHEGGNLSVWPRSNALKCRQSAPVSRMGACQILALAARDRDHVVVAGGGEPARNRKPDAAAAVGDEDVTHRRAPAFPLR